MNNLLLRRRVLMGMGVSKKEEPLLPDGYTKLEYVTRDSEQTYDGMFTLPRLPLNFEIKLALHAPDNGLFLGINASQQIMIRANGHAYNGLAFSDEIVYNFDGTVTIVSGILSFTVDESRYIVNGVDVGLRRAVTNMNSVFLDCRNTDVYYLRLFDNDGYAFYYVPCRRESDGVVGVYDIVNDVFKSNYFK